MHKLGVRSLKLAFCGGETMDMGSAPDYCRRPELKVDFKIVGIYTKNIYDL